MLQVVNHTPFVASLSVFPDTAGVETAYMVVKATFSFDAQGVDLAAKQAQLLAADVFWGEPLSSSIRAVGEFALSKPSTDVLLVGHAVAPGSGTHVADVSLRVGPVARCIRVFGDRVWQKRGGQWRPSDPQPWERMPLRWELAWGGVCPPAGDEVPDHEPRNPVGRGLVANKAQPTDLQPLPNLEDPQALLSRPQDRPAPVCFAPIAPTWQPRRSHAGTYDEAWVSGRAPYLPLDFDPRYFQVAPSGLISPAWLEGDEAVELIGFHAGSMQFDLPPCGLDLVADFDGQKTPLEPRLEMVLIEPDVGRLQLLWRAALTVDKKLLKLKDVTVRSRVYARDGSRAAPLGQMSGGLPSAYAEAV